MQRSLLIALTSALLSSVPSVSQGSPIKEELMVAAFTKGVVVDLREPTLDDGVLTTEQGGVISSEDLRIQARKIRYTNQTDPFGNSTIQVVAEEDLLMEYGCYVFVADRLEFDFNTRSGTLWGAKTSFHRWFIGGDAIAMHSDGSYTAEDAYITSCPSVDSKWQIHADILHLLPGGILQAQQTQLRLGSVPIFWLPSFATNLDSLSSPPLKYDFQWGGHQGPRATVRYQAWEWNHWATWLRMDWRMERGLALGLESFYKNDCDTEDFSSLNYIAMDNSAVDPDRKHRYMLKGTYHREISDGATTIDLHYEKQSDEDMETDYHDRDFEFRNAGRTELCVRSQDQGTILNLLARVRLNPFQNIKEELPTIDYSFHPMELSQTGIINDSRFKLGYLHFRYAHDVPNGHNFDSVRFEGRTRFYRASCFRGWTFTPEAECIGIIYGDSPSDTPKYLLVNHLSQEAKTNYYRLYGNLKHVLTPYAKYEYFGNPGVAVDEHYIFDLEDGWGKLNVLKVGLRNHLYGGQSNHSYRYLNLDCYGDLFFNHHASSSTLPRLYMDGTWNILPTLRYTGSLAWDTESQGISSINYRVEWTASEDFAFATEIRYRDRYSWRKLDQRNLILESTRSQSELLNSSLSDERATWLGHVFWRFSPLWALEGKARYGWCRTHEPSYFEYQIDLHGVAACGWKLRWSFQHKEHDSRVAFYIGLLKSPPTHCYREPPTW